MRRKPEYDATVEMGIPVTLIDAAIEHDDGSVEIPNLDTLLSTVAVARALDPGQLVGAEIRFLRHVLDLTGSEFAAEIDLSNKSVVSRWENDRVRPGGYTEKVIRQLVLNLLGMHAPGIEIGANAIPGMKIRPRSVSEGPLRISLRLVKGRDETGEGQSRECYAAAA
ncbi:MAG: hypothetical protein F4Y03_11660 [Alphaproteobacteria bacterium]|nr:hypothetical protein [Alphaproteobacteria bacterium]